MSIWHVLLQDTICTLSHTPAHTRLLEHTPLNNTFGLQKAETWLIPNFIAAAGVWAATHLYMGTETIFVFVSSWILNLPVSSLVTGLDRVTQLADFDDIVVSSIHSQCDLPWPYQRLWGLWSDVYAWVLLGQFPAKCCRFPDRLLLQVTSTCCNLRNVFLNTCPHLITHATLI